MTAGIDDPILETGVRNLDALLVDPLPRGSVVVVAGAPGSGETILAHQIGLHNGSPDRRQFDGRTLPATIGLPDGASP